MQGSDPTEVALQDDFGDDSCDAAVLCPDMGRLSRTVGPMQVAYVLLLLAAEEFSLWNGACDAHASAFCPLRLRCRWSAWRACWTAMLPLRGSTSWLVNENNAKRMT